MNMPLQKSEIRVFAPATVANVGCGFDIFGFAVSKPGDEVMIRLSPQPGVRITAIHGDAGRLPREAEKNTAAVAVLQLAKAYGKEFGCEIELFKKMPLGSGMGSSAASAVAALFGCNELLGRPFSKRELLPFAMESERIACGAAHADNVAPALFGGFVLIRSYEPLDVVELKTDLSLYCSLVHPHMELATHDARKILRKEVLLSDAIAQWGNTAGLVAGLLQNDAALVGRSLGDSVIETTRATLIPGFQKVKQAAYDAGALGSSISGSGPSVFALSVSREIAEKAADLMQQAFLHAGLESDIFISPINSEGPKVI